MLCLSVALFAILLFHICFFIFSQNVSGRNYRYFETSCVTGHNIDKVCMYLSVHCKGEGDSLGIVKAKSYASQKKDNVLISLIVLKSERCTQWWKRCTSWNDSVVNFVCYAHMVLSLFQG